MTSSSTTSWPVGPTGTRARAQPQELEKLNTELQEDYPSFHEWLDWQDDLDVLSETIAKKEDLGSLRDDPDNPVFKDLVLSWRLKKPYLLYCCCLGLASLLLLFFTAYENIGTAKTDIKTWKLHWVAEVGECFFINCCFFFRCRTRVCRILELKIILLSCWYWLSFKK